MLKLLFLAVLGFFVYNWYIRPKMLPPDLPTNLPEEAEDIDYEEVK